jgi:Ca-activated chloride channel family protein
MNLTFERPYAFYGLLLLIPAGIFVMIRYRRLVRSLSGFDIVPGHDTYLLRRIRCSVVLKTICRVFAWIFFVFAYAGISWGTISVPVQKNGTAISLVFDISYSMMAKDAPGGETRLTAAAQYATMLLKNCPGVSISVVLAKGDGFIAVPLTEDTAMVDSLLKTLSPDLMTAPGTSLGKGVETAIRSFPQNSAQTDIILVFTDGDETDGLLENSLEDSVKYGIPVTIIGFGSERETEVLAGDGKTKIKTALRSAAMKNAVERALSHSAAHHRMSLNTAVLQYIDATEVGSALKILRILKEKNFVHKTVPTKDSLFDENPRTVTYEVRRQSRQGLFLFLAIIFFLLSFVFGELNTTDVRKHFTEKKTKKFRTTVSLIILCCFSLVFVSCSSSLNNSVKILQSSWAWKQKKYQQATAGFIQIIQQSEKKHDDITKQYGLLGLSSTYIMLDENEAALDKILLLAPDAPDPVLFAAFYNAGIIEYRDGNYVKASEYFREALLIDTTNIDAKINFELCGRQKKVEQAKGEEQVLSKVSESQNDSAIGDAIFKRIRENDQGVWENRQTAQDASSLDY